MPWCLVKSFQDQALAPRAGVVLAGVGDTTFWGDVKRGGGRFLFEEGICDQSLPGARGQASPCALHTYCSHTATTRLYSPLVLESRLRHPALLCAHLICATCCLSRKTFPDICLITSPLAPLVCCTYIKIWLPYPAGSMLTHR